jgi:hypothetical protein
MKHTVEHGTQANCVYMVDERRDQLVHFYNPSFYRISQSTIETRTIMSEISSVSRLGQSLLEHLKVRHWDELECRGSRWLEIQEKQASHGYHELVTKVSNALSDQPGLHGSGAGTDVVETPACMHKRALCDLHYQICLDFVRGSDGEAFRYHRTKSSSPSAKPGLIDAGKEATSGHDGRGEFCSSCSSDDCTVESDQHSDDDMEGGLDDGLDDDGNDDSGSLPSVDACDMAEYDKEEVIQKDQVSQRRKQRMEIDQDDVRTLVSVSDDDDCAGGMTDPTQSEAITHASLATPKFIRKPSSRSPSTPKNTPSFLRRYSDKHSAQRTFYNGHYQKSPGYRTLRAVTTLSADPSYDDDVEVNEQAVRRRIMKPFKSKSANTASGFVYVFRDNELPLIKIGRTTKALEARKSFIERNCGFMKELSLVAAVKVKDYKRLEEIMHQDLAPHRRFFDCACGESTTEKGLTRHQEYFEIETDTALSTLQLWADFVERQPWEQYQRGARLKPNWHDKMSGRSRIQPSETHDTHDDRVKRWREFLEIPSPEVELEVGVTEVTYTPRLTMLGTAQKRYDLPAESSNSDYTPSKPSRFVTEDTAEADKPVKSNLSFSESLKRSSSSSEPTDSTHEQDHHNTAHKLSSNLPYRTKNSEPNSVDTAAPVTSSLQFKNTSNRHSVPPSGKQLSPIFQDTCEARADTNEPSGNTHDKVPFAVNSLPSGAKSPGSPIVQKSSIDNRPFGHIQFIPFWQPPVPGVPAPPATSDSTMSSDRSIDGVVPAVETGPRKSHQSHNEDRPMGTNVSPLQAAQNNSTMMSTSPLMQSMTQFATCLLAKEVRPLPARAISADIWQFRWPLTCSIAFALHSPHIPASLSFIMWSIFLPFFVAELRGWVVVGQA